MLIAAIDVEGLANVIWVSLLAGTGITVVFSLVVLSSGHSAAARREGNDGAAVAYAVVAVIAFALFAAGVALGVQEMISK